MTKLIILSGVPGSGKSHFAADFKFYYQKTHKVTDCFNIVSSDDLRAELTSTSQNTTQDYKVWETFYQRPIDYLYLYHEKTITILDSMNLSVQKRMDLVGKYRDFYDQIILVQFVLDPLMAQRLNQSRVPPFADETLRGYLESLEPISEAEKQECDFYLIFNHRYQDDLFVTLLR